MSTSASRSGAHASRTLSTARSSNCSPAWISGASVAEHVSVPVHYVPDFSAVAARVAAAARPGDVVVTMGAGDVTMLGQEILTALHDKGNR